MEMRGNKKGFMMTFLVLILFLLMFAEVVTFVTINITYNQISQNIQVASGTNNYAQTLSSSADSFAQASLQRSLQTLYLYESNASLRKSNFITNFNASIASLMETSTLANVTANSAAANAINAYMGGLALSYYNASLPRIIGASASYAVVNESAVDVFQSSPYTLSASYIENVYVNTSYGSFRYNIPVSTTISLNGTPNLLYAQQGITKYVQFGSHSNLTNIIGNQYALSGNTAAFQYGIIYAVPSGETCTALSSNIPINLASAPSNKTLILVTSDASQLTASGQCANNYGGLITTNIGSTNTPTNAYLIYSSNTVLNMLSTGEHELVYGPGLDTLNISGLRNAAANGYYFASPYAMSYGDIASDSVLHSSQDGIFTLSNFDTQVANFNGANSYIQIPNVAQLQLSTLTITGWVNYQGPSANYWNWMVAKQGAWGVGACGVTLVVCFYNFASSTQYVSSATVSTNKWYFLVAVISGGTETVYLNGINVLSDPISVSSQTESGMQIGYGNGASQLLNGTASNIQIYNTSLSVQQIQSLYQEGLQGLPLSGQNLVGYFPLDGNANDYSGNNNNGAATNVIYTSQSNFVPSGISTLGPYGINLNSINGAITAPGKSTWNSVASANQVTISAWVYENNRTSGNEEIVVDPAPTGWDMQLSTGTMGASATLFSGGDYWLNAFAPVRAWTLLTVTGIVGSSETLYVDGKASNTLSLSGATDPSIASNILFMGEGRNTSPSYPFNGALANVEIYDVSMSAQQVAQLYDNNVPATSSINVPVGWLP